jgi:nucleoside-diphosphate-sugar epimerase
VQPFNPYCHSKILAEEIAGFYERTFQVPVTIIRPFNLYGPGQSEQFLIPTLISQARDPNIDVITVADARPRRDFLYIDDMVRLLRTVLEQPNLSDTFNAGFGVSFSVLEVAEMIVHVTGTPKKVVSRHNARPEEVLNVVADISHAREVLGWYPQIDLEEGLRRTITAASGAVCELIDSGSQTV